MSNPTSPTSASRTPTLPVAPTERLRRAVRRGWTPPPRISVPDWADRYRFLAKEAGSTSGRWRTSTVEVARGPMLAVTESGVHVITVQCCTQLMKALATSTPIPTPSGWTTMGDLQPGDLVFDDQGQPCRVTAATGVMQQQDCYRVVFSDRQEIVCDAGHLWRVDDSRARNVTVETRVVTCAEIAGNYKRTDAGGRPRHRYAVPVAAALELPEVALPIPPYALGVWLGDGDSSGAGLTAHESDAELLAHLAAEGVACALRNRTASGVLTLWMDFTRDGNLCRRGHDVLITGARIYSGALCCMECKRQAAMLAKRGHPRDLVVPNLLSFGMRLRALNVVKSASRNGEKHIPRSYLRASRSQRLALLQGLMDTDGTIDARLQRPSFCTTSPRLRDDVLELLWSLGLKPTTAQIATRVRYKGELRQGVAFVISFTAYAETPVFRLTRKLARQRLRLKGRHTETTRRRIVLVEPVASMPVKCITVDSPTSMYLCGRAMIPTHNTALLENVFGYFAHLDPCPMLLLQPKEDAAEAFSKERITPMLRVTPVLRDLVGTSRTRSAEETLLFKAFPGGFLALAGAGSPDNLARRPIRVLLCDEIDKYPVTREGDPITLAEERTATFGATWLSLRACSPTIQDESRIEACEAESDQRRASVACPHCAHRQFLDFFKHVHWPKAAGRHDPTQAQIYCEACGAAWSEGERLRTLATIRWHQTRPFACCELRQLPLESYEAAWRAAPDGAVERVWTWSTSDRHAVYRARCAVCARWAVSNEHAGFQAGKLYSPWSKDKPANIAAKWLAADDDEHRKQAWWNTQAGLAYRPNTGRPLDIEALLARTEIWPGEVPDGVALLTAGGDVQDDRVELEIVGWGRNEESWSIAHEVVEGDPETPELWERVDAVLKRQWLRADGRAFTLSAACIDSGYRSEKVYQFSKARLGRRIWAIKGESARNGVRSPVWPTRRPSSAKKSSFRPVIIGVNAAKDVIRSRLLLPQPAPGVAAAGYMHFPADRDVGYFRQLVAERLVTKQVGGARFRVWELPGGLANEALDCRIYSYAALCGLLHMGVKLNRKVDQIAGEGAAAEPVVVRAAPAAVTQQATPDLPPAAPPPRPPRRTLGSLLAR